MHWPKRRLDSANLSSVIPGELCESGQMRNDAKKPRLLYYGIGPQIPFILGVSTAWPDFNAFSTSSNNVIQ
jgi:hypothetical protein